MKYSLIAVILVVLLIASIVYPAFFWNETNQLDFISNIYNVQDSAVSPTSQAYDTVGSENGYYHYDLISIDQSDGLSDDEFLPYISRAHARTEYILDLEFDKLILINVTTTSEFMKTNTTSVDAEPITTIEDGEPDHSAWNDQVWEALFIIGEDQSAESELENTSGQSIAGVYFNEQIVIVNEFDNGLTVIAENVLIHELVHALQDQEGHLDAVDESSPQLTQDTQLAVKGLVEGAAMYVEWYYDQVCEGSISVRNNSLLEEVIWEDWQCVQPPELTIDTSNSEITTPPAPINFGVLIILFHPYSDGATYVDYLKSQDGWDSVHAKYKSPPLSTEQIIHLSEDKPAPLGINFPVEGIPSQNGGVWKSFSNYGIDGADTVGEASIFSMFWHQSREYGAAILNTNNFWGSRNVPPNTSDLKPLPTFNYTSQPSVGWGNDKLLPLYRSEMDQNEYGYIWTTKWDTSTDADEFYDAYSKILDSHQATKVGSSSNNKTTLWVINNGPFEDAFAISTTSKTVTIINAPTTTDVEEILGSFSLSV